MKATYLTPSIVDGKALEKPESAAEYFVRGIKVLLEKAGTSFHEQYCTLVVRDAPDRGVSAIIEYDEECVVMIGLGAFFQQDAGNVAKAMLDAIRKVKDLTDEELLFLNDCKAAGLSEDELATLRLPYEPVGRMGRLEVHEGLAEEDADNTYSYHSPKPGQAERYEAIRDIQRQFALALHRLCPSSNEREQAIFRLNEVGFWANAAIARNESEVLLPVTSAEIQRILDETRPAYMEAKDRFNESEAPIEDDHDPKWEESRDAATDPAYEGGDEPIVNVVEFPERIQVIEPGHGDPVGEPGPAGEPKPE